MSKSQIEVLFENELLIAINKPAGLLSIPDRFDQSLSCAYALVKAKSEQLFVLHRLDRDTSGVLLFAKNAETHQSVSRLFEHHEITKIYQCITESCPPDETGTIDKAIAHDPSHPGRMKIHPKGKNCLTNFKVLKRFKHFGFLQVQPKTGRTHQIRVHLASIGYPLVCDPLYGIRNELSIQDIKRKAKTRDSEAISYLLQRTALHSAELHFQLNSEIYSIFAPLPKDLQASLRQLEKWDS